MIRCEPPDHEELSGLGRPDCTSGEDFYAEKPRSISRRCYDECEIGAHNRQKKWHSFDINVTNNYPAVSNLVLLLPAQATLERSVDDQRSCALVGCLSRTATSGTLAYFRSVAESGLAKFRRICCRRMLQWV